MTGYRNVTIVLATVLVQGFITYTAVNAGTDMASMSPALLAIASTAVGGAFARGYNKKHAPEQ
jgi:ABC-type xylose transport system permease subunit